MFRQSSSLFALTALALLAATDALAQEPRPDRRLGPLRGPSPEMIMSLRDRLELSGEQLGALEELRSERVAERNARRAEMEEMRSRLRAGEIDRQEMRTWMQDRRSQSAGDMEAGRERLEAILDADQLRTLNDIRVRRAEMRGRRGAMRGPRGAMRAGRPGATRGGRPGAIRDRRGAMRGGRPGAMREWRNWMRGRRGR